MIIIIIVPIIFFEQGWLHLRWPGCVRRTRTNRCRHCRGADYERRQRYAISRHDRQIGHGLEAMVAAGAATARGRPQYSRGAVRRRRLFRFRLLRLPPPPPAPLALCVSGGGP